MSYPPPPGLKPPQASTSSSTPPAHASLPPRPPPAVGLPPSYKSAASSTPTFSSAPGTRGYNGTSSTGVKPPSSGFGGFTGFQPRSVATNSQPFRTHSPVVSAPPAPPTGFSAPQTSFSNGAYQAQPAYQQPPTPSYYQKPAYEEPYVDPTPPQIRNPFPLPGQAGAGGGGVGHGQEIDPEMEAQIAQWQSAYAGKDADSNRSGGRTFSKFGAGGEGGASATSANTAPLGVRPDVVGASMSNSAMSSAANADTGVAAVVTGADGKQKTVVRSGGGQTWQDPSLLEWDPAHFRLFVGNLAGEVTDESLLKAFSKYPTVHKARVVRDKRTTKSKGYGFVSFIDGEEYFQAARDMQGKYIGSHPVLLRKSTTEIRPTVPQDKRKGKNGKGGGGGGKGGTGAGVQKKQSKTKGGLKVLG
ncbi:RNA-binding protein 42, partial [Lecanoromycetidae sp. Uapishka_2]